MSRPYNLDELDRLADELEAAMPGLKVDLDFTDYPQAQANPSVSSKSVPAIRYSLDFAGKPPLIPKDPVPLNVLGTTLADDIRNFVDFPPGLAAYVLLQRVEHWSPR